MDLFKWISVGSSNSAPVPAPNGAATSRGKPINKADYKQFGLENFGNTCYANSVLQALYFCQPFRELVCDSYDSSNPPIPQPSTSIQESTPALPPTRPPALKFGRRNSALDTNKPNDDTPANGTAPGKGSTSSAPSAPPIPASPPTLFSALRSLFLHIALNPVDKGKISPSSFINKLKLENELYRSTMHQDAHEFLGYLLNKIVEEIEAESKKAPESATQDLSASQGSLPSSSQPSSSSGSQIRGPRKTFVHSLFEGTLTSETRCLTCETVSSRAESFLDLSIDIEQNSSITSCLRQFSASEMLSRKNKFFCDNCGSLQEAEKRMKVKQLPNVLALHLKRFKYQEDLQRYIKLSYRVAFPFELRLFNTVDDAPDPDRLYQLFAIVVHIGNGPNHGHYISIVRAHGSWYTFDDDNVDPIKESDIPKYFGESANGSGYVLFYQAVDLEPGLMPTTNGTANGAAEAETRANGLGTVDEGSSRAVAIVVEDEAASSSEVPMRPVPGKLKIPSVVEPTDAQGMDTPTVATATAPSLPGESMSLDTPSLSGTPSLSMNTTNGFSDTATVSSHSSNVEPPPRASIAASGSESPVLVTPPPLPLPESPSLKHTQSTKTIRKDEELSESVNGHNVHPPLPSSPLSPKSSTPTLAHSRSWFSRRKSGKDKERPPIPSLPTTYSITSSIGTTSVISSTSAQDGMLTVPGDGPDDSSPSSSSTSHSPSTPTSPRSSSKPKSKSKSKRPSTSPSTFPSKFDEPLPPLPTSPVTRERVMSHSFSPSQTETIPVSSSPRSQTLPPPVTSPVSVSPSAVPLLPSPSPALERSGTTGSKSRRASRKMSLSAMPGLASMFGRNKDKEKDVTKSPVVGRRPSVLAGTIGHT